MHFAWLQLPPIDNSKVWLAGISNSGSFVNMQKPCHASFACWQSNCPHVLVLIRKNATSTVVVKSRISYVREFFYVMSSECLSRKVLFKVLYP